MSEWEPSDSVINAYCVCKLRAIAAAERGDIQLDEVHRFSLKAAVTADPLLSAAKDMQEALVVVSSYLTDGRISGDDNRILCDRLNAILAKSRGQQ